MQQQASFAVRRSDDYISLLDFSRTLVAEWRLVVIAVVIAAVLSVALAFILTPKYTAETVIIEKNDRSATSGSAAMLARFGGLAQIAGVDLSALGGSQTMHA